MVSEVEDGSAPTTPTLSSVAPSDVSLDDLQPMTDASSQVSDDELEMHPTLFIREDMVLVRVQRTLFRIPSFYLSHDSRYFSQLFSKQARDQTVHIRDTDVTSSGFANLLRVIRPPLGTSPLRTLNEWTDVLHLSSKWGFADLRTASLAAIPPLASPVDKLVLARTYSLTDWISSAYVDLLEREEDLMEEEAERMTIKDIVAIAKGRRVIRASGKVGPQSDIEKVVGSLLPAAKENIKSALLSTPSSSTTTLSNDAPLPMKVVSAAVVQTSDESHLLLSRWLDQLQSQSQSLVQSSQACLIRYLEANPLQVSLMLDIALERIYHQFKSDYNESCRTYRDVRDVNPQTMGLGPWESQLSDLDRRRSGLGIYHSKHSREAGLRIIKQWSALPLLCQNREDSHTNDIPSPEWQDLLVDTAFLSRCCAPIFQARGLIDRTVFAVFWTAVLTAFESTDSHDILLVARLLHALLAELKLRNVAYIACQEAYWEMDTFYRAVENAQSQAQSNTNPGHIELTKALDALIKQRVSL